jgi:hypothetical protein
MANPGRGWVVVKASDLSTEVVVNPPESGQFYFSTGVELARLDISDCFRVHPSFLDVIVEE